MCRSRGDYRESALLFNRRTVWVMGLFGKRTSRVRAEQAVTDDDFEGTADRYFIKDGEMAFRVYVMPDMVHGKGFVLWHTHGDEFPIASREIATKLDANRAADEWSEKRLTDGWSEVDQAAWIASFHKV